MLEPRIYRTSLFAVVIGVIVFAFALHGQPMPLGSTLSPDGFSAQNAYANMVHLARRFAHRPAGSSQDQALAGVIAGRLRGDGFAVSTERFRAATPAGTRTLRNIVAVRQGIANPAIVVVAHRDARGSPAVAEQSGTGVLLELGRVLSSETLRHTVVLASTTGSTGTAGAAQLAADLGRPVDAVLVLGDMAGSDLSRPLVVPWSDGPQLAPALLQDTVAAELRLQAGLNAGSPSLLDQFAHLAFPLALTEEGPWDARGIPAVLLSASGDAQPSAAERVSRSQITRFGRTALQTIDALDANARVPAPSSYLTLGRKQVPMWAVRLLALALILPVAATALDELARARRRRYAVGRPIAAVAALSGPFLAALGLLLATKAIGLFDTAPPGPVGPGKVPLSTGDLALLALLAAVIAGGFALLWAQGVNKTLSGGIAHAARARASGNDNGAPRGGADRQAHRGEKPGRYRRAKTVGNPGACAAVLVASCALAFTVWCADPFAALLLVPALHLWMLALAPEATIRPGVRIALLAFGYVAPGMLIAYYALRLGYGPIELVFSGALMVAGGHLGIPAAVLICALMGCGVSAAVNAAATARAQMRVPPKATPVTVRGPATYAGPGSVGGTASALSRASTPLRR